MSQAQEMDRPPPTAKPFRAPMMGCSQRRMLMIWSEHMRCMM